MITSIEQNQEYTFTGPNGVQRTYEASRPASFGSSRIYLLVSPTELPNQRPNTNWTISGLGIPGGTIVTAVGKFAQFTWKYAKGSGKEINTDYNSVAVNRNNIQLSLPVTNDILGPVELIKQTSTGTGSTNLPFFETKGIVVGDIVTSLSIGFTGLIKVTAISDTAVTLSAAVTVPAGEAIIFSRAGTTITFYDETGTRIQLPLAQTVPAGTTTMRFDDLSSLKPGYTLQTNASLGIGDGTTVLTTRYYNVSGFIDHIAKDIADKIPGTEYKGVKVTGQAYTNTATDILSLDTNITSEYTDNQLGQRPEDIVINGGKFIDTYSSHAPEELVPGQMFDSLQMNVFTTKVFVGNNQPDFGNVIAYKIFTDDKLPTVYYRLPANNTTTLAADLHYNDAEIFVTDITKLPEPNVNQNQPGSVWIGNERINYFGLDLDRGALTDIRRGVGRTAIPQVHITGSLITDASAAQEVDRDIVTPIVYDTVVPNGLGDTATYQSTIVSTIPQSTIWLNVVPQEFYTNLAVTVTGTGLYNSSSRQSGFLQQQPAYNPDIDNQLPKHARLAADFSSTSTEIQVTDISLFANAAAYTDKLGAVRIAGEVIVYDTAWTANSTLTGLIRTIGDTPSATAIAPALTGNVVTALGLRIKP